MTPADKTETSAPEISARHRQPITGPAEATAYIKFLVDNGIEFHFEDDPATVIKGLTGGDLFTPDDVPHVRARMADLFKHLDDPFDDLIRFTDARDSDFKVDPLPTGTVVLIRNTTMSGKEIIEGKATVRSHLSDDRYMVEFEAEPGTTYERCVRGDDVTPA